MRFLFLLLSAGLAFQEPPVPTGVNATTPQNAVIQVNWDANPAVGFNVYRAAVSGGSFTKLNSTPVSGTSYQDSAVASGTRYFYVVRAVNGGIESAPSSEVTAVATGTDSTPPTTPVLTSSTRKTKDSTPSTSGTGEPGTWITLYSGESSIGLVQVSNAGTWTIANPTALGPDGAYSVRARAADLAPNQSEYSSTITITLDTTPPSAPTNVRTTAFDNCVDVEWNVSTASDVAGYIIERRTTSGSWSALNSNLALGTKYRDTTAVSGTTYLYRVIAVDDALDY